MDNQYFFQHPHLHLKAGINLESISIGELDRIMDQDIKVFSWSGSVQQDARAVLNIKLLNSDCEVTFTGPHRDTRPQAVLALKEFFTRLIGHISEHLDKTIDEVKKVESAEVAIK